MKVEAKIAILDTGVLGMLVHSDRAQRDKIRDLLIKLNIQEVVIPEIADYELRRALLKIGSHRSLLMLDELPHTLTEYSPLTTNQMRRAAQIWAECRQKGFPFCNDLRLDGDCILISQAEDWGAVACVWTTNVKDIGRFVNTVDVTQELLQGGS